MTSVVTPDDVGGATGDRDPDRAVHDDPALAPIELPETRRLTRRRLRAVHARSRRRSDAKRSGAVLAVAMVVVLGLLTGTGHRPRLGHRSRTSGPASAAPVVPPVLLAQRDSAGHLVSLVILSPAAGGRGGTLVLLPPGTMTQVVGADLQPVTTAFDLGGAPTLLSTVENLLGAQLGDVDVVDAAALAALVAPAGTVIVNIPDRVEKVDETGMVTVVYPAGPVPVAPGDVGHLLAERGHGNDLSRLVRHQAFLEAWLRRLHDKPSAIPAQPASVHRALAALAAGSVDTRVVPVSTVGTGADGSDLYKVDTDELPSLVQTAFPGAGKGGAASRPKVQVLNGTGVVGVAQRVEDKLGPSVEVTLTGNAASFDFAQTQIVFYDRNEQPVAERVQKLLGVGRLVLSRVPIDVVDVTVVVGKDFT